MTVFVYDVAGNLAQELASGLTPPAAWLLPCAAITSTCCEPALRRVRRRRIET